MMDIEIDEEHRETDGRIEVAGHFPDQPGWRFTASVQAEYDPDYDNECSVCGFGRVTYIALHNESGLHFSCPGSWLDGHDPHLSEAHYAMMEAVGRHYEPDDRNRVDAMREARIARAKDAILQLIDDDFSHFTEPMIWAALEQAQDRFARST